MCKGERERLRVSGFADSAVAVPRGAVPSSVPAARTPRLPPTLLLPLQRRSAARSCRRRTRRRRNRLRRIADRCARARPRRAPAAAPAGKKVAVWYVSYGACPPCLREMEGTIAMLAMRAFCM